MKKASVSVAMGLLMVFAPMGDAQEASPNPRNCGWSTIWSELRAAIRPLQSRGPITEPKKKKGSIDRPESLVPRMVTGVWSLDLVIDDKGDVRDAKIIEAPTFEPPWPEYEAAVLKSVRKWKYSPLLIGKQALPYCMTLTVRDRE